MSTAVAVIVLSALGIALAVISFCIGWSTRGMRVDALQAEERRIVRRIPSVQAMGEHTTEQERRRQDALRELIAAVRTCDCTQPDLRLMGGATHCGLCGAPFKHATVMSSPRHAVEGK